MKLQFNKLTALLLTLAMLLTLMPSFTLTAMAADSQCGNHDNAKIQLSWNADENRIYYTGMDTLPQDTWCAAYIYEGTEQSENNLIGSEILASHNSSFELSNWNMVIYTVTVLAKFSDGCVKSVSDTLSIEIIPEILPVISYSKDIGLYITGAAPIPTGCSYTLYIYQVDENDVEHEKYSVSVTKEFEGARVPVDSYMSQPQLYRIVIKNGNTILSNVVEVDKRSNGDTSIKNLVCLSGAQAGQFRWSDFQHPEGEDVCYIVKLFKNGNQFYQTTTGSPAIDLATLMGYLPSPSNPLPQAGEVLMPGNTYTVSVQAAEINGFSNGGTYLAGDILSEETTTDGFEYTDLALAPGTLQIRPDSTETLLEAVNLTGFLKDRAKHVEPGLANTVTFRLANDGTWKDFDGNTPVTAVSGYDRLQLISFKIYGFVTIPVSSATIINIEFHENYDITITDIENDTDFGKATATVFIPTAGTYTLIFADYEGTRLDNVDTVTVTVTEDKVGTITVPSKIDITLGTGDKIMLWQDMTNLVPLCDAYIVK